MDGHAPYAIIDSYRYEGLSSFAGYQYPSRLPREAKLQMVEMAERLMEAIDYDQAAFNIGFFWDDDTVPGVTIQITAEAGERRSDLLNQDSYSYELALIHVGGEDEDDLECRYETCTDRLDFRFS